MTIRLTGENGRIKPTISTSCARIGVNVRPCVRDRVKCSMPCVEHWERNDVGDRIHFERFQPIIGGGAGAGEGGAVRFVRSKTDTKCEPGQTILAAGEEAGLELKYGCRIGICHTCVGTLKSGQSTRPTYR